jgi:hypothetical protein
MFFIRKNDVLNLKALILKKFHTTFLNFVPYPNFD